MARTSFDGATAVITGAGSGMGRSLALALADRGCRLALSDWDEAGLEKTAAAAQERGALEVLATRLDVRNRDAMVAHGEEVEAAFGDIHLVVNNAGVALFAHVLEQSRDDAEWIMDVDFWGVVNGTEVFLPRLLAAARRDPARPGRLVNTSSLFGLVAMPGQSAYNAAKFAVRGYTEAVAMELAVAGEPVTATCVHPGGIKTGIAKAARYAPGTDIERLTTFFDERLATMTADRAASIILRGAERGRPRVMVGMDAHVIHGVQQLLGSRYQRIIGAVAGRIIASHATSTPDADDAPADAAAGDRVAG